MLSKNELNTLLDETPVARLATIGIKGPHIVPVVFVRAEKQIVIPIDGKPKKGKTLQRELNIERNPNVSLLIDHYETDWSKLWWVRIDAQAVRIDLDSSSLIHLQSKYVNYRSLVEPGEFGFRLTIKHVATWTSEPKRT
ncbi:MAG: pyridoxamine 5'-phosphate oxidase family protein [Pseudomonadales bacterium]|nr:pyridoxamine 5'-phosphate oxidase family protein [Pseudomonadales bacterium]